MGDRHVWSIDSGISGFQQKTGRPAEVENGTLHGVCYPDSRGIGILVGNHGVPPSAGHQLDVEHSTCYMPGKHSSESGFGSWTATGKLATA
jgi:hypothetical protein